MDSRDDMLNCELDLMAISGGDIGLSFKVHNPGVDTVTVIYFKPFVDFDLAVWAGKEPVRVVQPAYDVPVQPDTVPIAPGGTIRIDTPIKLRFDAHGEGVGLAEPTIWSLEHTPTPILLHANLHLEGFRVGTCALHYRPWHPGHGTRRATHEE